MDKKNPVSRRSALRALTIASGATAAVKVLPEKWTRPVIESVETPVHAQTSGTPTLDFGDPNTDTIVTPGGPYPFSVGVNPPVAGVAIAVSTTTPSYISVNTPTGSTDATGYFSGTFDALAGPLPIAGVQTGTVIKTQVRLTASAYSGAVTRVVTFSWTPLP